MEIVRTTFEDRVSDIEEYFSFVKAVEDSVAYGCGKLRVSDNEQHNITPAQQKILYSNMYLKLYNLIESTVSMLVGAVERHACEDIEDNLALLSENMKGLYVKSVLSIHESLTPENRANRAMKLINQVLKVEPLEIKIPPGNSGNWDSDQIKDLCKRLGFKLNLPKGLNTKVNMVFKNDRKPIWWIKETRNKLAHGSISFSECGENHVANDLRALIDIVVEYFNVVIKAFSDFIQGKGYRAQAAS